MKMLGKERRKRHRTSRAQIQDFTISLCDRPGNLRLVDAKLVDISDTGLGIKTNEPLAADSFVSVFGEMDNGGSRQEIEARARVACCLPRPDGSYRIGLSFWGLGYQNPFFEAEKEKEKEKEKQQEQQVKKEKEPKPEPYRFVDYYEVMQLSPNADQETIVTVYQMLSERPGRQECGSLLNKAYEILGHPEKRAAYDRDYRSGRRPNWKLFDPAQSASGIRIEQRKRNGILSLLYLKRVNDPDEPSMNILELEDLLGYSRGHLEFSLWYLKENNWIIRTDNARCFITAKGIDQAEKVGVCWSQEEKTLQADSEELAAAL